MLKFRFINGESYTAPDAESIDFQDKSRGYVIPSGDRLKFRFINGEPYTAPDAESIDFQLGFIIDDGGGSSGNYIISCVAGKWQPAIPNQSNNFLLWEKSGVANADHNIRYTENPSYINSDILIDIGSPLDVLHIDVNIKNNSFENLSTVFLTGWDDLHFNYTDWLLSSDYNFEYVETDYKTKYVVGDNLNIDYSMLYEGLDGLTELESITALHFEKSFKPLDNDHTINWGYGLNNFVVGGITTIPSNPADDAIDPPDGEIIEHINYEVYLTVNIVNMTVRPSDTAIMFDNFSIQRDIESFAWTVTFDILNKASFELVRPYGRTMQVIDVSINGQIFTLVVAKASIQRRQGSVVYRCSGWSRTKLLADPYASKRSYKDTQARTAAQIVDMELTGTGFDYTWSTVDWQVPVGVHSYQDKTPLGAILEVVNAIGAVIVPDPTDMKFDVKPYYPNSPWQWDIAGLQRSMNERQFFEMSSETVPKENPDGVYVYGEDSSGVGVKAVRNGLPGTALLPDVVNKYMTENTAAQERGRVEVSKNSFIEKIPMTTYVDENGIIMPHELIQFTDYDGNTWRGMVLSTKVDCKRIGTALTQSITVARFYDDD